MKKVLKDKKDIAAKIANQAEHFRSNNENVLNALEAEWLKKLVDMRTNIKAEYKLEPN
jgi:hypothetical protein